MDADKGQEELQLMYSQTALVLSQAIQGLIYTSESDEPFEVIQWPGDGKPIQPNTLLDLACYKEDTPVETMDFDDFFRDIIVDKSWYGPTEKAMAERYRNLKSAIKKNLSDIQVFRVGEVNVDIYIIGVSEDGNWEGVRTASVET